MDRIRIQCVDEIAHADLHRRLYCVGGSNPNGTPWRMMVEQVIAEIESGARRFFVHAGGNSVDVFVSLGPHGEKYLATAQHPLLVDDLMSLPPCF